MNRRNALWVIAGCIAVTESFSTITACAANAPDATEAELERMLWAMGWPKCEICGRVSRSGARSFICTGMEGKALRFDKLGGVQYRCVEHGPARSFTFYPQQFAQDGEGWYERNELGVEKRVA